jgi:hypothetical protein
LARDGIGWQTTIPQYQDEVVFFWKLEHMAPLWNSQPRRGMLSDVALAGKDSWRPFSKGGNE